MGTDDPWVLLLLLGGSAYAAKLWRDDYRAARAGTPAKQPLPGATTCSILAMVAAAAGALVLLAIETGGEYALGIVEQQSRITALFGLYTLAAAFVEELIFRGFVVIENRGRTALLASVVGASLIFALIHPFLWRWEDGQLHWQTDTKAWFSFAMVLAGSLWFYTVRFWRLNPAHSLLPCIVAHATKNLGVFGIKFVQGFVEGWW